MRGLYSRCGEFFMRVFPAGTCDSLKPLVQVRFLAHNSNAPSVRFAFARLRRLELSESAVTVELPGTFPSC